MKQSYVLQSCRELLLLHWLELVTVKTRQSDENMKKDN